MSKKSKKISKKKGKTKTKVDERRFDFENFEQASKKLITALRLSLAKIKDNIKKGNLILDKKFEIMDKTIFNQNEINNNSTFPSLSFIKSYSQSNQEISDESLINNEYELSDINKNENITLLDFEETSHQRLIF